VILRVFSLVALAVFLAAAQSPVLANGAPKSTAQPRRVARLLSTSKQEVPSRVRSRVLNRSFEFAPEPSPESATAVSVSQTSDEKRAFDLINAERRASGRKQLIWDGELTRMARYHSANMAQTGFFHHVDRDGLDLTGRASVFGVRAWRALGENIAYNQGYDDPIAFAVERWMISDQHRENILNREFSHAGIGIAKGKDGRVFFTQVFMTR
jgi:uncharacterized protein YkwD